MPDALDLSVMSDSGVPLPLRAWRLSGRGDGPSAHLQAGLHADEIAGMHVLHTLLPRLREARESGRLAGTVTVVPQANPLGLAQFRHGRLLGRFHDATSRNFNRHFHESIAAEHAPTTFAAWQKALFALARESQIVLDLHTDSDALPYLYVHENFWPEARDLAAALRAEVAIVWGDDDDGAFEGAVVARGQREPHSSLRLAATIELRGQSDVSDALAQRDADGLYRFLCARGVIDEPVARTDWAGEAVPIAYMETVFAPVSGVLVYTCELGERVEQGAPIARIVARPGDPLSEVVLRAPQSGRVVTRNRDRLIAQGDVALKLTGSQPSLNWRGGALDP
ncbi:Succinylglutamate desuccinylase [Paraburkholderia sacchari]|uniref:succinylglutamate desuccinylase/aspartoacylase domain-containing protein n=1 Tax=Paraburkholderia sacchari TaxID=159450 RepID=UPI0039A40818